MVGQFYEVQSGTNKYLTYVPKGPASTSVTRSQGCRPAVVTASVQISIGAP